MELGGELQRGADDWLMTLEEGCRRLQVMEGELSLRSHEEPEDVGGAASLAGWVKNMADDMLDIIWELEEGPDPQLESCIDWTRAHGMMSTCYALFAEGRNLRYKLEERLTGNDDKEDENWQENGAQEDKANSDVSINSNNNNVNNYVDNGEDYNGSDDHGSSDAVGIGTDNNNNDDGDDNNNNCDDGGSGDSGGCDDGDRDVGIGDDNSDGDDNNNNRDGDDNNNNYEDGGNDGGGGSGDDGGSNDHGSSRAKSISTTGKKPHADVVGSGVDTDKRVICGVMCLVRWGLGLKDQSAVSPPFYLLFLHGDLFFSVGHRVGVGKMPTSLF
ncbi:hypothetical protein CBR_g749 [Chara braunii]|uniref:Uncharacterized protein n=1 Tax=Chara braunii TaxID=69332 RepID=A0A388KC58_CHABU|nr:hypothetical protein CBR_g749 [Chara braunii]|eukprot:GBG67619.1 hypothetical protein CBR_g749 [Chara braunii]